MARVRHGVVVGAAGVLLGCGLALGVSRTLSGSLWGVEAFDPLLLTSLGAVLFSVVVAASYWPARRAARVDPMFALRIE